MNYKKWKQELEIESIMDLDLVPIENRPDAPNEASLIEIKANMKNGWRQTASLLWLWEIMSNTIPRLIPKCDIVKRFLDTIGQKLKESDKAQTWTLMNNLSTLKCKGNIHEHILRMIDAASKLKSFELTLWSYLGSFCF